MTRITGFLKAVVPAFPRWSPWLGPVPSMPKHTRIKSRDDTDGARVVYFPACISRLMGSGANGKENIMETFLRVAERAGVGVVIPESIRGGCCGQIFSSKGFADAYRHTANDFIDRVWDASNAGKFPVVIDVSSCAYTLRYIRNTLSEPNRQRYDALVIMDSVEFLHDIILPRIPPARKGGSVALHPVCSLEKMGTREKFIAVARHFAAEVTVPLQAGCCGMAGDRGFLFPELTASATHHEASEVQTVAYDGYYSSTKTCEIALSEAVKANYESILYLVDEATA